MLGASLLQRRANKSSNRDQSFSKDKIASSREAAAYGSEEGMVTGDNKESMALTSSRRKLERTKIPLHRSERATLYGP